MHKPINIATLSYELNTMVRKHREAIGYTQEEFAFLIGKEVKEIQANEDLTTDAAYDINHCNFYARVLKKSLQDMFFTESFSEANIKLVATKSITKNKKTGQETVKYKGTGSFNEKSIQIESYSILSPSEYKLTKEDENKVLEILEDWLKEGYFENGVTGYTLFQDLLTRSEAGHIQLPDSFRPILVARAVTTLSNKRKKPKLLPHRKLPKTPEKWLIYKEDK